MGRGRTQRDPHDAGFVNVDIVIGGGQPREDETEHDGERDRQPPHLHEVHLTGRKEKGRECYLSAVVFEGGWWWGCRR